MPSYTARELERESGFDRRTIAYYVQEGLLPRVGRRGPRTRYPQPFLDRLLFIRRVRQAEEEGDVAPVSLAEMREVFERIPPALVAAVAKGRIAVTPELVSSPSTAFRMPQMPGGPVAARESTGPRSPGAPRAYSRAKRRLDRMRERDSEEWPREAPEAPADASRGVEEASIVRETPALRAELWSGEEHEEPALASLLALLRRVARARTEHSDDGVETWARIRVTPEMVLSVRGIDEEDRDLVERVQREIRRAIDRG
ncbi:MAG: MerR family transcriptional regulator [Gemmatimonadetes bacterium]|nr:MerR family transcriptional regulator [Gemmatimonadota bacterium]MXX73229.1 MerR family transcriptional regulator [Gemmatimonadota bacterium]MYC90526.1 MerR family transcriptional regulator [Gemmatimonadota bacterium]MYG34547.1 MerR family transcriptional regulator [Gemmatimonadota bacterium]MYJ18507.1 MerR family transcriptional regulator [Gemmatimonadota bacterium]